MSSLKIVRFKVQLDGGGGMVQETCYARILDEVICMNNALCMIEARMKSVYLNTLQGA